MVQKIYNNFWVNIKLQLILAFLFFSSSSALIMAYISQYVFGLLPCPLCIYQRIPFFLIIFITLFAYFFKHKSWQKIVIKISIFLLIANAALALYHVGVEQKIFIFDKCANYIVNTNNLEDLKQQILTAIAVRCDEPQLVVLGISMAGWNVVYCLFIAFLVFFGLKRHISKDIINDYEV